MVFSDDWGRHASSCQDIVRELLADYDVDWVNTIGTRRPRLRRSDWSRGAQKLRDWLRKPRSAARDEHVASGRLRVHAPWMWPRFSTGPERALNRRLLIRSLRPLLEGPEPPAAVITTISLMADVAARFSHLPWFYYCVDMMSEWPGADREPLAAMERELVRSVRGAVSVSRRLQEHLRAMGRDSERITHGVDLACWRLPPKARDAARPVAMFWGLIDRRLDTPVCLAIAEHSELVLVGPRQDADPRLLENPNVSWRPAVDRSELPAHAARADVLVLPYADNAATRAMQPLKLKELLATGRPVVATPLPWSAPWREAMDRCATPRDFAARVSARAEEGALPAAQVAARAHLREEAWGAKARAFDDYVRACVQSDEPTVLHARIIVGRGGGPEKTILASPAGLRAHGYRGLAAYLHNPGDPLLDALRERAADAGCPLELFEDRSRFDRRTLARLEAYCVREGVRIWHAHDYKSNLLGLYLRRRIGMHLVTTVHGWLPARGPGARRKRLYRRVDDWCLRRYDRVLVVSPDLREVCLASGVPEHVLRLVPNAIDSGSYQRRGAPGDAPLRAAWGTPAGRAVLCAAGRLSPEKGFDALIGVVAERVRAGEDVELWILGEGEERAALEARVAAEGMEGRVRLPGHVDDVRPALEGSDVFVLSSTTEALPNVVLEAMAMSVPVVAADVGGVRFLLGEDAGLVCEPHSPRALRAAIGELLADPERRLRLARAGRARVERDFGFARRMERVAEIYDGLSGRRARGSDATRGAATVAP